MNKELEQEAQSYLDKTYSLSYERTTWQKLHEKTFVAGATSIYVEKQKLVFAIEQLKEHVEHPTKPGYKRHDVLNKIKELEQKLSEL